MKPDMSRKRGGMLKRGGYVPARLLRNINIQKGEVCLNIYNIKDSRLLLHRAIHVLCLIFLTFQGTSRSAYQLVSIKDTCDNRML